MLFESGAILIHIGGKDERLLPRDAHGRARAIGWVIAIGRVMAALNSIEPQTAQLTAVDVFDPGAEWRRLRRSEVVAMVAKRLGDVAGWLGDRDWLEDRFTTGDMLMVDALRGVSDPALLAAYPNLAAYVTHGTARPAFKPAMAAQLANFVAADTAIAAAV